MPDTMPDTMPDPIYLVDESATCAVVNGPPPIPAVMRFGKEEATIIIPTLQNIPGVMVLHGESHVPKSVAVHLAQMILLAAGEVDGLPQGVVFRSTGEM